MKKTILFILCLLTSLANYAYDFEVNGYYYNIVSVPNRTVQLTCSGPSSVHNDYGDDEKFDYNYNYTATYTGDFDGNFIVPKTVDYAGITFTVTSINTIAFVKCVLNTLTIPETVEEVAMEQNSGMGLWGTFQKLIVEDSEKPIRCHSSLVGPTSRTYIDLINWTKEDLEEFARNTPAYWEQVDLTYYWAYHGGVIESVYLGRQIQRMWGDGGIVYADSYSPSYYKEIEFGENVTSLFYTCRNNVKLTSVTLPSSIKSLSYAFSGCTALESVAIPSSVKSLSYAFSGCKALKSIDAIGVETISGAFSGCTSLETVNLPMLRSVNNYSFMNCTSLKSITFAPGLVEMKGEDLFAGSNIESIVIPSTLVKIGEMGINYNDEGNMYYDEIYTDPYYNNIFTNCSSLKTITVCNPNPVMLSEKNFDPMTFFTTTLKVPVGSAEAYRNAYVWKNFFNIEEDASISNEIFTVYEDNDYYYSSIEVEASDALPAYTYNSVKYKFVKKGETVTIKAIPYDKYSKLTKLTINGIDVTEDVDGGVYQTTVVNSMAIKTEFGPYEHTVVTIPEAKYTAYVTEFDADFTESIKYGGLTVYKVTEASTSGVMLEPVETASKGTAVILHAELGEYGYYPYNIFVAETGIAEKHNDNLFKAGGNIVGDGKTIYALGNKNGIVGFYLVKEGVTVPANKGYLVIDPSQQPNGVKEFIPFGGDATGIEMIGEKSSDKEDVIYNLSGQRVTQPTKSGIYIVNGKKVFINK